MERYVDPAAAVMREIAPALQQMMASVQQGMLEIAAAVQQLAASIQAPKQVVRDQRGLVVGVASPTGEMRDVVRGQDGQIVGVGPTTMQ